MLTLLLIVVISISHCGFPVRADDFVCLPGQIPIAVSGYNHDVVLARGESYDSGKSATLDAGPGANSGYVYYELGWTTRYATTGLTAGLQKSVVDAGTTFSLQPFNQNNCILLSNNAANNAALRQRAFSVSAPALYDSLALFATAGSAFAGGFRVEYTLYFNQTSYNVTTGTRPDGGGRGGFNVTQAVRVTRASKTVKGQYVIPDWFGGRPIAARARGRAQSNSKSAVDIDLVTGEPFIYQQNITYPTATWRFLLNTSLYAPPAPAVTAPWSLTRIDLRAVSGTGYAAVFGVSGRLCLGTAWYALWNRSFTGQRNTTGYAQHLLNTLAAGPTRVSTAAVNAAVACLGTSTGLNPTIATCLCTAACNFNKVQAASRFYCRQCDTPMAPNLALVNSCTTKNGGCHALASCTPLWGTSNNTCKCPLFYDGDGYTCAPNCDVPLGMASGVIRDAQLTSSSSAAGDCTAGGCTPPQCARLDSPLYSNANPTTCPSPGASGTFITGAWSPRTTGANLTREYLEVYLLPSNTVYPPAVAATFQRLQPPIVSAIATQGRADVAQWVTQYQLSWSLDGVTFFRYTENGNVRTFVGNTDQNTVVKRQLALPVQASHIRVHPIAASGYPAMRIELFGCIGMNSLGCFTDAQAPQRLLPQLVLDSPQMTTGLCAVACMGDNGAFGNGTGANVFPSYPLFGVEQGTQCWCGRFLPPASARLNNSAALCGSACAGDANQKCGGAGLRQTIYAYIPPINECVGRNGGCDALATCHNPEPGNITCTCPPTYTPDALGQRCFPPPPNMCQTRNGECDRNANCSLLGDIILESWRQLPLDFGVYDGIDKALHVRGPRVITRTPPLPIKPLFDDPLEDVRRCSCNAGYSGNGFQCSAIEDSATISAGALSGAIIGPIIAVCLLCFLCFFCCRGRRDRKEGQPKTVVDKPRPSNSHVTGETAPSRDSGMVQLSVVGGLHQNQNKSTTERLAAEGEQPQAVPYAPDPDDPSANGRHSLSEDGRFVVVHTETSDPVDPSASINDTLAQEDDPDELEARFKAVNV